MNTGFRLIRFLAAGALCALAAGTALAQTTRSDRISFLRDNTIGKAETVGDIVTIGGSSTVDGTALGDIVSIAGDSRATGPVDGDVVAILGNIYINSRVERDVTAVLGTVELGPKADIGGDIVSIGGIVKRDPAAVVAGDVKSVAVGLGLGSFPGISAWLRQCLLLGRPLAFSSAVAWAWVMAAIALLVYTLVALIFGGFVTRCAETLEKRPGGTLLTALLAFVATPLILTLVSVTGAGVLIVPVLGTGLLIAGMFGRATLLTWVGRRLLRPMGMDMPPAALAVLLGGAIVAVFYTVPILGIITWQIVGTVGFGAVVYTALLGMRRETVPGAAPAFARPSGFAGPAADKTAGWPAQAPIPAVPPADPSVSGFSALAVGETPAVDAVPVAPPMVPVPPVSYPFAGFWIRMAAVVLDVVLVSLVVAVPTHGFGLLPGLAIYTACLWRYKSATVGGIICGIQIMRTDGRPMDWTTAVVRSLGCFLSAVVIGLGFLWIAFDPEKRGWHDKIAGTVAVRPPKGLSLI